MVGCEFYFKSLNVNTRVLTNNQSENNDFYIENFEMCTILLSSLRLAFWKCSVVESLPDVCKALDSIFDITYKANGKENIRFEELHVSLTLFPS